MSEASEIKRDGAVAQTNSGRNFDKGDAILGPFCVDYKEYAKSFGVSRSVWAKISMDAFRAGRREPALKLILGTEGESKVRVWVIGESMFNQMLEAWKEKYEVQNEAGRD